MATLQELLGGVGVKMVVEKPKGGKPKGAQTAGPVAAKFNLLGKVVVPRVAALITSKEERDAQLAEFSATREAIATAMADAVRNLRYVEYEATAEEASILQSARDESEQAIITMLGYEPPYRAVSVLAYASALVRTCPETKGWVEDAAKRLVEVGFLKPAESHNAVRVYNAGYVPAGDYGKSAEAGEVLKNLADLVGRERIAAKQRFEAKKAELDAAVGGNPLSIADLKAGKDGRLVLHVPDQIVKRGSDTRTYKGGFALVDSAGGKVRILDGAGGLARISAQLNELGVYVGVSQLEAEKIDLGNVRVPEETFRSIVTLQKLLQRGLIEADEKSASIERKTKFHEEADSERQALAGKATLTSPQFFLLDAVGTCLVDPLGHKPFVANQGKKNEARTFEVFALVARDEKGRIRVAEAPERLTPDFFEVGDKEFKPAGDRFAGLSWRLRTLLKMGFAASLGEATDEEKEAHLGLRAQRVQSQAQAAHNEAAALAAQLAPGEDLTGLDLPPVPEGDK